MNHAVLRDSLPANRVPKRLKTDHSVTVLLWERIPSEVSVVQVSDSIITRGVKITIGNTIYNYNLHLGDPFWDGVRTGKAIVEDRYLYVFEKGTGKTGPVCISVRSSRKRIRKRQSGIIETN